jgi:hypothetical protein
MNAATISTIVSWIPERVARVQSGASFHSTESTSRYPERVSHLARFLSWLSPLNPIGKDDQHILGLLHANGRPVHANEMDSDESAELEEGGADALEYAEAETAVGAVDGALLPHERETLVPQDEEALDREEALV